MSAYSGIQHTYISSVANKSFIDSLDGALSTFNFQLVHPLKYDKWIAVSNLHKSIRRGDLMSALMSAQLLVEVDPNYLYKRLAVIAFEDIGIANASLCLFTLNACSKQIRNKFGQTRLAYYLIAQLVSSVKSRAATDIFCLTMSHPDSKSCLNSCLNTPVVKLVPIALDTNLSLIHRISAIKVITGFSERQSNGYYRVITKPRIDLLERICEEMPLTAHQMDAALLGNGKSVGLNAGLLLAAEMLSNSSNAWVIEGEIKSNKSNNINLAALDIYCKSGRTVISQFVATSQPLQQFFNKHPNKNPAKLVGTALFNIEGSLLYRGLGFTGHQDLKDEIEYMELVISGIKSKVEAINLINIINQEMPLLNSIRISYLG